jgi:hypothetical protein
MPLCLATNLSPYYPFIILIFALRLGLEAVQQLPARGRFPPKELPPVIHTPGSSSLPLGSSSMPPGSCSMPPGSNSMPPGSSNLPTDGSNMSTGTSSMPTGSNSMPPGGRMPPANLPNVYHPVLSPQPEEGGGLNMVSLALLKGF